MFQVFARCAGIFFDLMTLRVDLKNILGAIILLLLCSWTILVQAIPAKPSGLGHKFSYDLDASETPVFLPGQFAIFKCAEQIQPDTVVQWLKDGFPLEFSPTSKLKKRRKTIHNKDKSDSRHLRSLNPSTEPRARYREAKATSSNSISANLTNSNYTVWSNGSLCVPDVKQTHAGEYKCFMQDSYGMFLRRKFNVTIANLPQCAIQPSENRVHVHSAARFYCSTNIPRSVDVTFSWTKDGQLLPNDHKRFENVPNGALHFYNIISDDAGSYQCQITSKLGTYTSDAASLTVLPQAKQAMELKFIVEPQNITVFPPNKRAIFECLVNDPNRTYSWTKKNGKICNYHCPLGTSFGNNLILNNVPAKGVAGYSSNDLYECKVRPRNSHRATTRAAFLNVLEKPIASVFAKKTKFLLSQTAEFSCSAHGNPSPKIYWIKDGRVLDDVETWSGERDVKLIAGTSYLRIASVEMTDAGYYQCIAENIAGTHSDGVRLDTIKREYVPAPVNVTATVISESEIFIQWRHPPNFKDAVGYRLEYSPGGEDLPLAKTTTSHSLIKLHPYTVYKIKVTTFTEKKGPSDPSITEARTMETAPCGKVWNLNALAVNSSSLLFMWPSLPKPEQCGIVTKYQVTCYFYSIGGVPVLDADNYENVFEVPARQFPREQHPVTEYALISGLEPGGEYVLATAAATNVGTGVYSEFESVNLPTTELKTCIENGDESALLYADGFFHENQNHLIVFWKLKPNLSFIANVSVTRGEKSEITQSKRSNASDSSVVFGSVNPREPYIVNISLFEPDGKRCETRTFAIVSERDDERDENLPQNITGTPVGSRCIKVEWDFQEEYGLDVYFVVRYDIFIPLAHKKNYRYLNSTVRSAEVCNLQPYSHYEFAVAAIYSFESLSENTTFARLTRLIQTPEEEPGAPADFSCSGLATGVLECAWREPEDRNGEILSYVLLYQAPDMENWHNVTTTETSAIVHCLPPQIWHVFKVYAINSAGVGKQSVLENVAIGTYDDASDWNCTFGNQGVIPPTENLMVTALVIGIAIICIIVCILLLFFCLPGRQAKFALYRQRKKKKKATQNDTNKTDSLIQAASQPPKQNGYHVRNGYHVTDREALDEQQINLLPKNGDAFTILNGNGCVPQNGYRKHHIVKKNGFHKDNASSKLPNGVTKPNGLRDENGTARNSIRLGTLRRAKVDKSRAVPESNRNVGHSDDNHQFILSVPIPKHCSKNFKPKSSDSDELEPDASHASQHQVSVSCIDEIHLDNEN